MEEMSISNQIPRKDNDTKWVSVTWAEETSADGQRYSEQAALYGLSVNSVGWGSTHTQRLRFSVLSEVGDLRRSSVLDVGCGLADFHAWLSENHLNAAYMGVDVAPGMVRICAERFPDVQIHQADLLTDKPFEDQQFDFVFASGIFAHRKCEQYDYLLAMVREMYRMCRVAIAFNSLSTWAPKKFDDEFNADPCEVVRLCRDITPRVVMRHDYMPNDFTIYLYRPMS